MLIFLRAGVRSNNHPEKQREGFHFMLQDLNKSIELDSTNNEAIFIRFQTNMFLNDFNNSLVDINTLIRRRGNLPLLTTWKGNCAFAAKKFEVAERAYFDRLKNEGTYDEIKSNYYYYIFSKYFGGKKDEAMWECAVMKDRGFELDTALLGVLDRDQLQWEQVARFSVPEMTQGQLEALLGTDRN